MKKLKLIKLIASILIVVLVLALNQMEVNAEWRQDDNHSTDFYEYTGDSSSRTVDDINTLSIAGQDYMQPILYNTVVY